MSAESYFRCLAEASEAHQPPCARVKELASLTNAALVLVAELDEKVCALYDAIGCNPERNLAGELVAFPVRKEDV